MILHERGFRGGLKAALLMLAFCVAHAQTPGDDSYQPKVGQAGKDVVWIPTPDALVTRMLQAARTTSEDLVYDLGSGDGKIPMAAARDFNARAVGIEYNPELAALARRNAERAGVAGKVTIIAGDIFETDFSKATVVTLYLLPELNSRLRPTLLRMKPGTRIVSHAFDMRDWEPDETMGEADRQAFLWIVPANVAGHWRFSEARGTWQGTLDLVQAFQRVGGTVNVGGKPLPLLGPALSGTRFSFSFVNIDGTLRSIHGTFDGDTFEGAMRLDRFETPVSGRRASRP
jgi:SAM-dependent methyltransferase